MCFDHHASSRSARNRRRRHRRPRPDSDPSADGTTVHGVRGPEPSKPTDAGMVVLPGRARPPPVLQGAGAPLRRERRRRRRARLLRPHRLFQQRSRRELRLDAPRPADEGRAGCIQADVAARRWRTCAPRDSGQRQRPLLGRLLLRRRALLQPGGQRPRLRGVDRVLPVGRSACRSPASTAPQPIDSVPQYRSAAPGDLRREPIRGSHKEAIQQLDAALDQAGVEHETYTYPECAAQLLRPPAGAVRRRLGRLLGEGQGVRDPAHARRLSRGG